MTSMPLPPTTAGDGTTGIGRQPDRPRATPAA